MSAFVQRVKKLRLRADISGREFSVFVGVPKSTMESWLRGVEPHGYTQRRVEPGLRALELELDRAIPRLPIPLTVRHKDRLAYVKRIRANYR